MAGDGRIWDDVEINLAAPDREALRDELEYRIRQREIQAFEEQALAARDGGERFFLDTGEVKLQVHPYFYHHWGQKLGYECWSDEAFVREFIRDNEEVRVKNRSRQCRVGFVSGTKRHFRKTYDW